MAKRSTVAVFLSAIVLVSSAVLAQVGEFRVNSSTAGGPIVLYPAVAADEQGRFVVAWWRDWYGPTRPRIAARRFDATGVPLGAELNVNTMDLSSNGKTPAVAYEANGGFVVAWHAQGAPGTKIVMARRFDAAGAPRGPEFTVAIANETFVFQKVAARANDGFVVVWWETGGLMARRYDGAGVGLPPVTVDSGFAAPAVTMTPDGGFVVAWAQPGMVSARLYDAASVPRGPAFTAHSTPNFAADAAIGSDLSGGFTIAWHESGPTEDLGPMFRKFGSNGAPLTASTVANTFTLGIQNHPQVAVAPNGEAIVVWTSIPQTLTCPPIPFPCPQPPPQDGSGSGVFARRIHASGNPVGADFGVNTYTTGTQQDASVAMDAAGQVIVAWGDPTRHGIYARRLAGAVPAALAVDRVATPTSNGNGVLEQGEDASFEPAWRNASTAPVAASAAAATLTGPPGPTYATTDATASYGIIAPGTASSCVDLGDCYVASITGSRPATHWDAVLREQSVPPGVLDQAWGIHVGESFADTPVASPFYRFVETLLHRGVTGGCGADSYCPAASVPREQMPVFVLRSWQPTLAPIACFFGQELFADVPASSPYCPWIEDLARRGVVAGCGGGNYCPTQPVSRETMAVYLGATLGLNPPPCGTPVFTDVPASSPYCRWIEELVRRGVVSGCGGGNYCPTSAVSREQMAVFLTVTFGLSLYGP